MKEDSVELFDYFSVIWKRKILIIVVTLVCTVAAVVAIVASVQEPLVTYRADAVVKIGKKVKLVPSGSTSPVVEYIEDPGVLAKTIPLSCDIIAEKGTGYHLSAERISNLAMIKLNMKGPDRGVERVLKEVVDMLIDEHSIMVKDSGFVYRNFMKDMEADAEMLKKDIFVIDKSIKEMKRKEGEYLVSIETNAAVKSEDRTGGDRSAFLNMLYLKTIDRERDLSNSRSALRRIKQQLSIHRITLGNLEEYKTKLVGEVKSAALKPDEAKSTKQKIMLAGIASLIMALFIAFIVEYIEESKLRRKGKLQG
jgi:hypothetical protein